MEARPSFPVQTGPRPNQPPVYSVLGLSPGLKKPVRFADRPPSSSAEVAIGLKLCFHLLSILAQARHGLTFTCTSNFQSMGGLPLRVRKPLSEFIKGDKI